MNKTKLCPQCKKEIDAEAKKCPHCQSDLRNWFRRHPIVSVLLVVFVIFPLVMSQVTPKYVPDPLTADQITNQKKHDFAKLAKMNVEDMLKSPSTAKFNTSPVVKFDGKTYSVDSWVDSQNSYGAVIRSYWSVKAHYIGTDSEDDIGTGKNWIIEEFIFDGKKLR